MDLSYTECMEELNSLLCTILDSSRLTAAVLSGENQVMISLLGGPLNGISLSAEKALEILDILETEHK